MELQLVVCVIMLVSSCIADDMFTEWGQWSIGCSTPCGFGVQTRKRGCVVPTATDCLQSGLLEDVRGCNNGPCLVDGGYTEWEPWSICNRKCAVGSQFRQRRCENPVPDIGAKDCSDLGDSLQFKPCNTFRCADSADITQDLKDLMKANSACVTMGECAFKYANQLEKMYKGHYFAAIVYKDMVGYENHVVIGTRASVFHTHSKNVVIGYNMIEGSNERRNEYEQVGGEVLNLILNTGYCHAAKIGAMVWNYVKSRSGLMVSVVYSALGNDLVVAAANPGLIYFEYICKTVCGWFGKCTHHKATVFIVFGDV